MGPARLQPKLNSPSPSKAKISPATGIFAVVGLVVALASVISKPGGAYNGATTRIAAPKATVSSRSAGTGTTVQRPGVVTVQTVTMTAPDSQQLVETIARTDVFRAESGPPGSASGTISTVPPTVQMSLPSQQPAILPPKQELPPLPALILKGIVDIGEDRLALVKGPSGDESYYREGDVVDGMKVVAVGSGSVTVQGQGRRMTLQLSANFSATPLAGGRQ